VNALRLACGLLTALRVGRLPQADRRSVGTAMLLAPLTVVPLLVAVAAARGLVVAGVSPLLAAALVVSTGALYTRAVHLDGLADTADGLSAGYDPQSSLRAMKASDTGPSGVAAVVLSLVVQVAALASLLASAPGAVLAGLAWVVSRHTLALACRRGLAAAQPTGLGNLVAGSVGAVGLVASVTALGAVAGTAGWWASTLPATLSATPAESLGTAGPTGPDVMLGWWLGPAVALGGVAAVHLLLRRCRRRLGGVTGDVLGAGIEASLSASLVVAALLVATTA
jgi:adenosylcobinamide-GDP ribazoletransferase